MYFISNDWKMLTSTLNNSTVKNIALVCIADLIVGISYGALALSQGFDWWVPLTLSILVLAGASEFLFIGSIIVAFCINV